MPSTMMKDSQVDDAWLREMMQRNPPSLQPNGDLLTGPVRIFYPNIFQVGKPGKNANQGQEPKFGAALQFPPGAMLKPFEDVWNQVARAKFPSNWDPEGRPVGLHWPFHDGREKAYAAQPQPGFTPGAIYMNVSSKFKPQVVHVSNPGKILDPKLGSDGKTWEHPQLYDGAWVICALNSYDYKNVKIGVGFGLKMLMIVSDDTRFNRVGGDPVRTFAGVQVTAQSNIAAKFDQVPAQQQGAPAASVMPSGGHVGTAGTMAVTPLPGADPWD